MLYFGQNNLDVDYMMERKIHESTSKEKDLVFLTKNVKFNHHIKATSSKANSVIGFINRMFDNNTVEAISVNL